MKNINVSSVLPVNHYTIKNSDESAKNELKRDFLNISLERFSWRKQLMLHHVFNYSLIYFQSAFSADIERWKLLNCTSTGK